MSYPQCKRSLLAQVIVDKYCDQHPLYRQEQACWTHHRVHLPRQTMANWMGMAAEWLKPIYETIRTGVMDGGYVQVDESSGARKPKGGAFARRAAPEGAGKRR